jgi:hypothetical protein
MLKLCLKGKLYSFVEISGLLWRESRVVSERMNLPLKGSRVVRREETSLDHNSVTNWS